MSAPRTDPKADDLVKQAEKKLKSFSLFNSNKHEEAIEFYTKAAAMYKMNKNWQEAGDCYVKSAEISDKIKEEGDVCKYYLEAGKAYKNVSNKESIRMLQIAVDIHMENNRFSTAAKIWKDIADQQEKELNISAAMLAMEKAASCFDAENASSNSNACRVKVAQLAAESEDYPKAIEIYENVSKTALDSSSAAAKWSVKDWLFKALLCQFVLDAKSHDLATVKANVERYRDMLPQLDGTRESTFIDDAITAFEEDDVDKYTDVVFRFDEICKLDNWSAKVLLGIKKSLANGPEQQGEAGSTLQ